MDNKKKIRSKRQEIEIKSSNRKINKSKDTKFLSTEHILLGVFVLLLILVVFLSFMVIKKKRENDKKLAADLVIPVLKVGTEESFSLNISSLDEYVLKITNYREEKVNEEEISYNITVENNSDSEIEVTKGYSAYNLMKDQKSVIIDNQKLREKVKQDVFYHIKVTRKKNVKSDDNINVKIAN